MFSNDGGNRFGGNFGPPPPEAAGRHQRGRAERRQFEEGRGERGEKRKQEDRGRRQSKRVDFEDYEDDDY